jgi:hypothetical protein
MVQRVRVILEDDIDGSPAGETVRFALTPGPPTRSISRARTHRLYEAHWPVHRACSQSIRRASPEACPAEAH